MTTTANPITPERFAAALADLPLSSLHEKAAEIRNSLNHLRASNTQLQEFAEQGDRDCAEAIAENEVVLARMEERLELLKAEVVGRGMMWVEDGKREEQHDGGAVNGTTAGAEEGLGAAAPLVQNGSGRYTDAELASRLQQQLDEEDDDGVHL